jgi:hypothetical protein
MNLPAGLKFPFCSARDHINGLQCTGHRGDIQVAIFENRRRTYRTARTKLPYRSFRRARGMRRLASTARVVFEQGGPVFDGFGIVCLPHHQDSDREDTVIDLFQVGDAKPEVPGCRNVSGLAIEQILRGITMKFLGVGGNAIRIVLP